MCAQRRAELRRRHWIETYIQSTKDTQQHGRGGGRRKGGEGGMKERMNFILSDVFIRSSLSSHLSMGFFCVFYDCLYTRREYVSHSSMLETHSSSIIVFDGSLFSYSSLGIFFIVLSDISPPQPQHTGCAILQNASSFPSNCAAGLPLSERWNEPGFVCYDTTMVGDCMCAGSIEEPRR